MEQTPENPFFDKISGIPTNLDKEIKSEINKLSLAEVDRLGTKIEGFEIEKTERDIELIDFVEKSVDQVLAEYGRSKVITIPLTHIHLLTEGGTDTYTQGRLAGGAHSETKKNILVDRCDSDVEFCLRVFHEMVHLKSYSAIQLILPTGETTGGIEDYRSGITVTSRDGTIKYLNNLEEALVGYLTQSFYENVIKVDPRFNDEISKIQKGEFSIELSRKKEMEGLQKIVDAIFLRNRDMFSDKDEVLDMFIDAQINGNLMKVGRIIEKTFGEGSLRKIDVKNQE